MFSNQLSPCWAVPPVVTTCLRLETRNGFGTCSASPVATGTDIGVERGVDCHLHAGGGVGCNHTMVLQTLRAPSFWTPPDFAEKSQALSKRGRRMDHRDLVAGAQVRVLHGA